MINMNEMFITKMIQSKRLEKEALKSILPEFMVSHLDVIEDELIAMMKELAKDAAEKAVVGYSKASKIYKEAKEEQTPDRDQHTEDRKQTKANKSKVSSITIE